MANIVYWQPMKPKPAVLLIVSGVCWLVGALAFAPFLTSVYASADPNVREAAVAEHAMPWVVQNLFFFAGVVAGALGLIGLVSGVCGRARRLANAGRIMLGLAVTAWTILFFGTVAAPLGVELATIIVTRTFWMVAALTTLATFVLIGLSLIASREAILAGTWMAAASALLFCAAIAMRSALPPLLFFQVLLVAGVALMVRKPVLTF
jgi:hypothetical protein